MFYSSLSFFKGERKRVNITMEIIVCLQALLLEEPTSDLDTSYLFYD